MFTLTYTNMAMFRDCPFKFKTSVIDGIKLIAVKESLRIGSAFHLYREKGEEAVEDYLNGFYPSNQAEADQLEVQKATVRGLVSIAPLEDEVQREVEWLNPLVNPATGAKSRTFQLGGKADGLVRIGMGGNGHALIEEKTRGGHVTKSDIDKLSIDTQVLNAIVNLEKAYPDLRVSQVWYRYYMRPSIRQRKDETVSQFCERIVEDYASRPDFYFREEKLMFPRAQLEAFKYDLWQVAKGILWFKNHDLWYRNTSHCSDWGGCAYLPICRGEDTTGLYKVGEPNPELTKEESNDDFATRDEE